MVNFRRSLHSRAKSIQSFLSYILPFFAILLTCSSLILFSFSPPAGAADEPYWQSAIPYFEANDFKGAYTELERLLKARPDDPLLLRLQGVCLIELGNYDSAVKILERSVTLDPESIACRYYYARALACQGSLLSAIEVLNEVIQLSPDSEYAKQSQAILPELKNLAGSVRAIPDVKRWNLYANTALEYDDNVPGRAKNSALDTPKDSWRNTYTLYGEYRVLDQKIDASPLSLGCGYSINGSTYHRNSFSHYDMLSQELIIYIRHSDRLWDRAYTAKLQGGFSDTMLDWEDYSNVGSLDGSFDYRWHERITAKFIVGWYKNYFENDSEFPEFYSRDGDSYKIGVENYVYCMKNRLVLGLRYIYRKEDTEGKLFVIRSNDLTGSLNAYLPWQLHFSGSVIYQEEDYTNYTYDPKRLDDLLTFYASIERPIWKSWLTLRINYIYNTADSNFDFAEYRKNTIGISLSANY